MEPLPRLKARIASLHDLRDLFHAMRILAASHVQEAQRVLPSIRRYVGVIEDAIAEGASLLPETAGAGFVPDVVSPGVLIVICSEHGFVGALNERLLERVAGHRKPGQRLAIVGQRGMMLARETNIEVERSFAMATHVGGVLGVTRRVADYLAAETTAEIIFAGYRRGGRYEIENRTILPLDPDLLVGSERRTPPLHHLTSEALLQQLANEYLFSELTHHVTESFASENGARLQVMEAADHNVGEKLDDLHRSENALRQEAITSELLDVVTGSEAILAEIDRGPMATRAPRLGMHSSRGGRRSEAPV